MYAAVWNAQEIARGADIVEVEGRLYFRAEDVRMDLLHLAPDRSVCEWKGGEAEYFDIVVDDATNRAAAWRYPALGPIAKIVEGRLAFWQGVDVSWRGDSHEPARRIVEAKTPNVAKALGVEDVAWLPSLPAVITGPDDDRFPGYLIPSLRVLVNVRATPPDDALAGNIAAALSLAERVGRWNTAHPDEPYAFVAVWGSTPPSPEVVALLRDGHVLLALADPATVVAPL